MSRQSELVNVSATLWCMVLHMVNPFCFDEHLFWLTTWGRIKRATWSDDDLLAKWGTVFLLAGEGVPY